MLQRHIDERVADLLEKEGVTLTRNDERLLLTRERLGDLLSRGKILHDLYRLAEKDVPLVGVLREGLLITTFRPTRRINQSPRRQRHGRSRQY